MRLFVAVYPPAGACDDLERHLAGLDLPKTTRRETWHVTLAFLGDVDGERVPAAAEAVARAGAGTMAPELRLAGGGRFGTVLWCGVDGERILLDRLADRIRRELRRERLPFDKRPFRPHLTVSRPRDHADRSAAVAGLAGYRGPSWTATSVDLVRSTLGPVPTYETLAAAGFGPRAPI